MSSNVRYPSSSTQFPVPLSPWPVYQMSTENNQESPSSIEGYPNIVQLVIRDFFGGVGGGGGGWGANAEDIKNLGALTNNKKPAIIIYLCIILTSFLSRGTLQFYILHRISNCFFKFFYFLLRKMTHELNYTQLFVIIILN